MKVLDFVVNEKKQDFFFMGCIHYGVKSCNLRKLHSDLQECRKRNARIIMLGDNFDAIVPKDPRYMPKQMMDQYVNKDTAIDDIVEDFGKILLPYSDLIDVIGDGNHEWQLAKRFHTNPTARLVRYIRGNNPKSQIQYGGYEFYALYKLGVKGGGRTKILKILCHHGIGTSAPVTRGIIDVARIREGGWQYDILAFAHKHKNFAVKSGYAEPMLSKFGNIVLFRETRETQVGTYKMNLEVQHDNDSNIASWEEMKFFAPANLGGNFVRVEYLKKRYKNTPLRYNHFEMKVEV